MNYKDQLKHYRAYYQNQIHFLEDLLSLFPPGEIHYRRNGDTIQYILHIDGRYEYIHTKNRPFIREMVLKDFLNAYLTDCRSELEICGIVLKALSEHPHTLAKKEAFHELMVLRNEAFQLLQENGTFFTDREWQDLISGKTDHQFHTLTAHRYTETVKNERRRLSRLHEQNPDALILQTSPVADPQTARITDLLFGSLTGFDSEVQAFLTESFPSNPSHPEHLIYTTIYGEKMRSKLEVRTAELLRSLGIPYRYEALLIVGNQKYYPDFTLMHPRTHEIYILEIFSMMDDPEYAALTGRKLYHYSTNGYVINQNLLCYSEQKFKPIDFIQMKMDLEYRFAQ